jgi:hypothetical protein
MQKHFFLFIAFFSCHFALAQPNKKVGPALSKFLNTEFMVKFHDLRVEAESQSIGLQARQDEIAAPDLYRLRAAYDQTAHRANQLLENIKQDFLNPKKVKTIAEFPDMYADGLRYKLQDLSDFYAAHFGQALADATIAGDDLDGSALLLLVTELIGLTKGLADYFGDIRQEARSYTEAHLQENLVQPYRWRSWDELAGSVSSYESYRQTEDFDSGDEPVADPLDRQLQHWTEKLENTNSGNAGWDDLEGLTPTDTAGLENPFLYEDWSPDELPADSLQTRSVLSDTIPAARTVPAKKEFKKKPGKTGGDF